MATLLLMLLWRSERLKVLMLFMMPMSIRGILEVIQDVSDAQGESNQH
jgi:hypothetical protein